MSRNSGAMVDFILERATAEGRLRLPLPVHPTAAQGICSGAEFAEATCGPTVGRHRAAHRRESPKQSGIPAGGGGGWLPRRTQTCSLLCHGTRLEAAECRVGRYLINGTGFPRATS
jgi:hypothetical protein